MGVQKLPVAVATGGPMATGVTSEGGQGAADRVVAAAAMATGGIAIRIASPMNGGEVWLQVTRTVLLTDRDIRNFRLRTMIFSSEKAWLPRSFTKFCAFRTLLVPDAAFLCPHFQVCHV